MSTNISTFGISLFIVASKTFPQGITIDEFSDEGDPISFADADVANFKFDVNGNPIFWANMNGIPYSINVLPGTDSARNMQTLYDANRPAFRKKIAFDEITTTVILPGEKPNVLTKGAMIGGTPGTGSTATGRAKTLSYTFIAGDKG